MSMAVKTLCDEFWDWRLKESPELASFCGVHDYDDQLDDTSVAGYERRAIAAAKFLDDVRSLLKTDGLTDVDKLNLRLLESDLVAYTNGQKYRGYVFPICYCEGIHIDFEQLTGWMVFNNVDDFKKYTSRLQALPKRLANVKEVMQLGIKLGYTHHKRSLEKVADSFTSLSGDPESTCFLVPFKSAPESLQKDIASLKEDAIKLVKNEVQPALAELRKFIEEEYMKHTRPKEGVMSLPDGENFYKECLKWHLETDMSPEKVHEKGKQEVARIKACMIEVIKKTGFDGDFQAFLKHLRTDKKFYYENKDDLYKGYVDICYNQIRPTLQKLFHKIPESELIIEAIPESRKHGPAGFYLAGTLDGSRPGKYYVNLHKVDTCPKYEMMTLSLHEGEPGHHFQSMYAIEMKDMPKFRNHLEDMNYFAVPSRFPIHTSYVEGWGLYCEYLGEELGLYDQDPYSMFGHLSFEMHRACRLVADTGIHYFGWTHDEAFQLFMDNTALSELFVTNEVRRYITWPGQACGYKIGELKLKELRKLAKEKLGDAFDVRDFHEEVLKCGNVPLTILEEIINNYIERKLVK